MAGHKKKRREDHGEHPDERWLVTYADLMTLLVALFMVLFSISSVNKTKFESLQQSLQDAFSGRILPGGRSIKQAGGTDNIVNPSASAPVSSLQPFVGGQRASTEKATQAAAAAVKEQETFKKLKERLDAVAASKGVSGKVHTAVTKDGLLIRLVTDGLLFDSGSATVRPESLPLLSDVADLLAPERDHAVIVQGNTDNVPVRSGHYVDNLELSTDRASAIFRVFARDGIPRRRMTSAGNGEYRPLAPNTTAGGRALNRRVEVLIPASAAAEAADALVKPDLSASIRPNLVPSR
jgi:chemotaxis protein MotB